MKKVKVFSILLISVILAMTLFSSFSFAQDDTIEQIIKRGSVRVGFCADVPPLKFRDKNGEVAGMCADYAEALARDLGVKLEYVFTDWGGLIPALLGDRSDIIIADVSITLERAKKINYSKSWMDSGVFMAVQTDSKWKSWKEMNHKDVKIGVMLGSFQENAIKAVIPNVTRSVYNSVAEMRLSLEQGRIDGYCNDLIFIAGDVRISEGKLRLLPDAMLSAPFAFAVRPDDQHWLNWVNLWIDKMGETGEYDELMDYWVNTDKWLKDYPGF